ncbi:cellulose biosynthesis protein BcsQ [Pseudomonas sp. Pseusp122]|uniref:cellulose biosynthesis protein BcsQ n=1 Tax=unclassified Pseudomonas TaxID=196821 RepID=UPI0039A7637B
MNDIANLLNRFGAGADSYLEIEDLLDYKELLPAHSLPEVESSAETGAAFIEHVVTPVPQSTPHVPVSPQPAVVAEIQPLPTTICASDPFATECVASPLLGNLIADLSAERKAKVRDCNEQALRQALVSGEPPSTPAHVLAVVSSKGGVGKSTLSAALSAHLKLDGGKTIAIDLDPQNALQYHLGVTSGVDGVSNATLTDMSFGSLLLSGQGGTLFLPYGEISESGRRRVERTIESNHYWLASHLARMDLTDRDVVVLDTPPGRTLYMEQALQVADEILVVTTADTASFMALEQMNLLLEGSVGGLNQPRAHYVINLFDASRPLSLDVCELLKRRYGTDLLGVVSLDHSISEDLAYGVNPLLSYLDSPVRQQVSALADALKANIRPAVQAGASL